MKAQLIGIVLKAIAVCSLVSACGGKSPGAQTLVSAPVSAPIPKPTAAPPISEPSGTTTPRRERPRPPSIRQGHVSMSGSLPRGKVDLEHIVKQNFGRFRLCYENGLRVDRSLRGVTEVEFLIDGTGSVQGTSLGAGTTLPDQGVAMCIKQKFEALSFPAPLDGRIVQVTYSVECWPGDLD